jgi:exopolysaccharide production protein ExoZ
LFGSTQIIGLLFFLLFQFLLPSFYKTKFPLEISAFLSTFFLIPGHIMINGVSWTLSFELFFYLLFSVAFIIPNIKVCLAVVGGFAFSELNSATSFILHPMNLEFIMGICAAIIIPRIPLKRSGYLIIFGTFLFLVGGGISNMNIYLFNSAFNRVIYFGIPAMFLILGIVRYELSTTITIHSYFILLGEASYSLYLIHLPIVAASAKIFNLLHVSNPILLNSLFLILIFIISWLSIIFYQLVEKPIINIFNSPQTKAMATQT